MQENYETEGYRSPRARQVDKVMEVVVLVVLPTIVGVWVASIATTGVVGWIFVFIIVWLIAAVAGVAAWTPLARSLATTERQVEERRQSVAENPHKCPECHLTQFLEINGVCRGCGVYLIKRKSKSVTSPIDPNLTVYTFQDRRWVLDRRGRRPEDRAEDARRERYRNQQQELARQGQNTAPPRKSTARSAAPPEPRLIRRASEAEELCAEWIRWMGFTNAQVSPPGTDGGLDVIGEGAAGKIVAQVKFEAVKTGRPKLQELYGAGMASQAAVFAFFASAGYTNQAETWANGIKMALFEFELDGSVVPTNDAARRLFNP